MECSPMPRPDQLDLHLSAGGSPRSRRLRGFILAIACGGIVQVALPASPPPLGAYLGNGGTGVARVPEFTAWFGRAPDRALDILAYDSWSSFEADSLWSVACWRGTGAEPVVAAMTFSVPLTVQGTSLADVAAGLHDNSFLNVARAMVASRWGGAVIRLGWEFNGSWMPWAAGQDPASYVGAYRHVVGLMRSVPGASFTFDWCCAWGPTEIVAESVYPGDDVVDIIGMDIYGRYYAPADGDEAHDWNTSLTSVNGLNWLVSFAQAHGKSLSLPEWGTGEWFVNDGGNGRGDDPVFIESVAHFLTANRALYSDYWDYSDSVYDSAVSDGEHPHAGAALKAAFGATEAASSLLVPGQVPPLSAGGPATAGSVSISFAAPLSGGPAAAYVIQDRVTGQSAWTTSATVTWVGWQTLAGLAPGTSYDVEVYATNASGSGVASAVFSVRTTGQAGASAPTPVPMLLPGPIPAIGAGGPPTASSVSISFAAPYAGGPVAAYVIQWRVRGTADWANNETVTWIGWQTLAGLVAGTSYDVEVYATNAAGSGPPSAVFTVGTVGQAPAPTPTPTPGVPKPGPIPYLGIGAASTATSVSISFSAPYTGGPSAAYVIQYRVTGTSPWLTYATVTWIGWQTVLGLNPATAYDLRVYATNSGGSGQSSQVFQDATTVY